MVQRVRGMPHTHSAGTNRVSYPTAPGEPKVRTLEEATQAPMHQFLEPRVVKDLPPSKLSRMNSRMFGKSIFQLC